MKHEFTKFIPPESPPKKHTKKEWKIVQEVIDFQFPKDFCRYIDSYGQVYLCGFINVYSPFKVSYRFKTSSNLAALRCHEEKEDGWAVYPHSDGLYPIARDENASMVCWIVTDSDPDTWQIVTISRSGYWEHWDETFTSFFLKVFDQVISPKIWDGQPFTSKDFYCLNHHAAVPEVDFSIPGLNYQDEYKG